MFDFAFWGEVHALLHARWAPAACDRQKYNYFEDRNFRCTAWSITCIYNCCILGGVSNSCWQQFCQWIWEECTCWNSLHWNREGAALFDTPQPQVELNFPHQSICLLKFNQGSPAQKDDKVYHDSSAVSGAPVGGLPEYLTGVHTDSHPP